MAKTEKIDFRVSKSLKDKLKAEAKAAPGKKSVAQVVIDIVIEYFASQD